MTQRTPRILCAARARKASAFAIACATTAGALVCTLAAGGAAADALKPTDAFALYAAAWAKVNTYTCTVTAHEANDARVQDRVYSMYFAKPHDTRMDIVRGDGRGSAAVWRGGDTVRGHQGGFLRMFKLNLDIHARLATSIRGTTIAQANWGALLDHLTGLKSVATAAAETSQGTTISIATADPSSDNGVTREVVILGKDGLPVEYDQFQGEQQVKRVTYSGVKLNVDIPASTWSL